MEDVFSAGILKEYATPWEVKNSRNFTTTEIDAIRSNTVVPSQYGKSVCFFMKKGTQFFIPVSPKGKDPEVGSSINLSEAKLVTLGREGDTDIIKVEL